jgi:hypothetical protein
MRRIPLISLVAVGLTLSACAEFYSIGRRTTLPAGSGQTGVAIHLDAQQRLMMVGRTGTYCAEASPDAMAAYAAALALGVSVPSQGAGSGAQASQSDIAAIGLRTQSITLMRDALYRLCEASANGTVSDVSATQLLGRSQDLTAVVVAVEQLTGATVAAQAALTHSANADSTASAIGGADQIDAANKNVELKADARARAESDLAAKDEEVAQQERVAGEAKAAADAAAADDPQKRVLEDQSKTEQNQLATRKREQNNLQDRVANAKESEARARDLALKAAEVGSQADTSAAAGTSGDSKFQENKSRAGLTDVSAKEVAKSVENMVTTVLNKDYTGADCMVLLTNITSIKVDPDHKDMLTSTIAHCQELLAAKIQSEVDKLRIATYGPDESSAIIREAMKLDPTLKETLDAWLAKQDQDITIHELLSEGQNATLRVRAIADLGIKRS